MGTILSCGGLLLVASRAAASITSERERDMESAVGDLWGQPMTQTAPAFAYFSRWDEQQVCKQDEKTKKDVCSTVRKPIWEPFSPAGSDIKVKLGLDQRRKGLLWFSLYNVDFAGDYKISNDEKVPREIEAYCYFPNQLALYDNLEVRVLEKPDAHIEQLSGSGDGNSGMRVALTLAPGETVTLRFAYRSRGKDDWRYSFGNSVKVVKNFKLVMTTDFSKIDFPGHTISPDDKKPAGNGYELTWDKKSLVSGFNIGMTMPKKINPGPLAEQMSFFAPVSLLFFFFVMFVLTVLRDIKIHPMNFFFLAMAFFAFHLLFAYTVDHLNIYLAFAIASVVSVFLVVSYLRLVVGDKFAWIEAGGSQLLYLVVFSFAHFFQGYTGLIITVLSIVTLFLVMQATGKLNWEEKFKPGSATPASAAPKLP